MNISQAAPVTYFLLRLVTGLLFFQAGAMKHFGWFGGMPGGGTPPLMSQIGIGGLLEVAGGIAIMLGLLTRAVAFVLSVEMAVAYWHMAYSKPRPTGGPVLFHLPVYGRTRCRRVEPRRADSSQARRVMKVDWIERPACLIFVWCAIGLIQNLYHDKE